MLTYRVTSLADLPLQVADWQPTHVVSLLDPDMSRPVLKVSAADHLFLKMHDLDAPDLGDLPGNPSQTHVQMLLDMTKNLPRDHRVLFHCVAGQRRSTAAALICDLALRISSGSDRTQDLVDRVWDRLMDLRPVADPNLALLAHADPLLGFDGVLKATRRPRYLTLDD